MKGVRGAPADCRQRRRAPRYQFSQNLEHRKEREPEDKHLETPGAASIDPGACRYPSSRTFSFPIAQRVPASSKRSGGLERGVRDFLCPPTIESQAQTIASSLLSQ